MSRMLNLGHVLEFIIDALDNCPLSEQNLVCDSHQRSLHVAPDFGEELYPVHKQFLEQTLAYVSLVPDELAGYVLQESGVLQRVPVIDVARGQHETQEFPLLVAYQMQLETVEPSHRALSSLGQPPEHPVQMNPLVAAHPQGGAVNEAYSRASPNQALLQEQDKGNSDLLLKFSEPVV